MSISMIGLDTAKSVFQIHGVNETGKVEIKCKLVWFKIVRIWVTQTRGNHRPAGVGF